MSKKIKDAQKVESKSINTTQVEQLSWEDTYKAMRKDNEDWSEWHKVEMLWFDSKQVS